MKTLGDYLLEQPHVEKQLLFSWIKQILVQLQAKEQIGELPDNITPFHIKLRESKAVIVDELETMDVSSYSLMDRFVSKQGQDNRIYSFGKTIQFLFAKTHLTPKLTWREGLHFRKIISKCLTNNSKKQYRRFSEINLDFPHRKKYIIGTLLALGLTFGIIGASYTWQNVKAEKMETEYLELGVSYFLLQKDYKKSKELFELVERKGIGAYFVEVSSYMAGESSYTDFEMEIILNEMIRMLEVQEGVKEKACIVRAYEKVDTPNARRQIKVMTKDVLEEIPWGETRKEMREILANVYFREGEYEKALREYQALLVESEYEEMEKTIKNIKKKTW